MTDTDVYSDLAGAPYIKPAGPSHENFAGEQGDPVGFNAAGEMVHATAAADGSGSQETGPVAMRGVLYPDHVTDVDSLVADERYLATNNWIESNDTLSGEHRITAVAHGFIVQNADEDWGFACGEPVYLSESGGFTQTAPSTSGAIVQVVGYPVALDRLAAGEAVWVDPAVDYETVV